MTATTSSDVSVETVRHEIAGLLADPERRKAMLHDAPTEVRHLLDVLQDGRAVLLPADRLLSTGQAAEVLGVSRMTVVRLIDRGELQAETGGAHRRVSAAELDRYRFERSERRRKALMTLGEDIDEHTPADRIMTTR